MSLIVSNDWETVLRRVKDDKAYQQHHMSTNAAGSKKGSSKRKRLDSNEKQKLDDGEDDHATPQPIARIVDDIDLTPRPPRPSKPTRREYDASLDSIPILQNPYRKQDAQATRQHVRVDTSHKQDLNNYMIVEADNQVPIQRKVLYQIDDLDNYHENYPGGYAPASEDNYHEGYVPSSEDYYYPQPEYVANNNHSLHRKPLRPMATHQVAPRPSSPSQNVARLKTQLVAEARTQPIAYRGDILHHARVQVDPSAFYNKQTLPPPSSRSLANPAQRPFVNRVGQSRLQIDRIPPIGNSSRFEHTVSEPQVPHYEPMGSRRPQPQIAQFKNAVAGPSRHKLR